MNRRLFLAHIMAAGFGMSAMAQAAPFAFEEGVHFKLLPENARSMLVKGSVQEFFFYGCSHCMDMEQHLHQWLKAKPNSISFEQIPAVFQSPAWAFLARTHYALKHSEQLNEQTHKAGFEVFIIEKAKPKNDQEMAELIAAKYSGFDKESFVKAFQSELTSTAVNKAAQLSGLYQLEAVPSFVINGKYLTDLTMAGSHAKLFSLIEQLASK